MDTIFLENTASVPPSLFGLGVIPVYGLLLAIGFAGSFIWAYVDWNKNNYRTWDFIYMSLFVSAFALFGAKIWYMIFDPVEAFKSVDGFLSLLTVIFIPTFGRSIIGSIVFAPLGIWIYKKKWGPDLETWKMMDIMLPALFIGQAIGRWGNFFNHDVYGIVVSKESLDWLPDFIQDNMYIKNSVGESEWRTPLFLYESMADLLGFIFIILVFKINRYWKDGAAGMCYIALYGLIRSSTELFRDTDFIMYWGNIPTSFVASIILIIVGLFLVVNIQWGSLIRNKLIQS